ncbi:DUF4278 domain-containing protein [Spirulina major CS-329]|uniref:DUF4278 domain-containing protein n=1 Tax=Spirulina TaxID=1154 RepID=UPI00232B9C96|nr:MULTISPECIES: DUF4278 domain-containing protein [Spirulina]MDB9494282.1 DUF4278 domain-containing protein [Spirulina subsalsa CS-330]MDB9503166.1 DUF4278 domain-containing protein [Spirulina major CS-329]
MKLSYRGHSYTAHTKKVNTQDVAHTGMYRGVKVTFHDKQAPVQHAEKLIYRGVHIEH